MTRLAALAVVALIAACGDDADCPIDLTTNRDCHGQLIDAHYPADRCGPAVRNTLLACPIYLDGQAATSAEATSRCSLWFSAQRCTDLIDAVLDCWEQTPPVCNCGAKVVAAQDCWQP